MSELIIAVKTKKEIEIMKEGGKKLSDIKKKLADKVKAGVSALEIEELAETLINKSGGNASFKMVPNYSWATCVNVNDGIVHGIPKKEVVFKEGDVVSVDVGLFYKGFHTDTSLSVGIEANTKVNDFLAVGKSALKKAILKAKPENRIYDISQEIEKTLVSGKYEPVRALVGHGVGRELHEEPQIPCFIAGNRKDSPVIPQKATLAIEVMYTMGSSELVLDPDGWTISTRDGKIAALFEETVAVGEHGSLILTE